MAGDSFSALYFSAFNGRIGIIFWTAFPEQFINPFIVQQGSIAYFNRRTGKMKK
jgi:hypothetical protein